jgi:hypothetical protein
MENVNVGPAENGLGWLDSEDDPVKYAADLASSPEWIKKKVNSSHENRGVKPAGHNASAQSSGQAQDPKTQAVDPETGLPVYESDIPF